MKLKYIEAVSFRQSEWTNFQHLRKTKKFALRADEVACFISLTGDQIVFIYTPTMLPHVEGTQCCHSERLRLTGKQKWNPTMLADYAAQVGIELDGIHRFTEHYKKHWTQGS